MNRPREARLVRPIRWPMGAALLLALLLAGPFQPPLFAGDKALPPDLALVPQGDPAFISIRLADLVNSKPGKQFLQDLHKEADTVVTDLQRDLGLPLEEIERLTVLPARSVLIVHTVRIEAEILRRGTDGIWPEMPEVIRGTDPLDMRSIGLVLPVSALYRTTALAT